jgi:hypothetical protein
MRNCAVRSRIFVPFRLTISWPGMNHESRRPTLCQSAPEKGRTFLSKPASVTFLKHCRHSGFTHFSLFFAGF